jgi:hypothetical protein
MRLNGNTSNQEYSVRSLVLSVLLASTASPLLLLDLDLLDLAATRLQCHSFFWLYVVIRNTIYSESIFYYKGFPVVALLELKAIQDICNRRQVGIYSANTWAVSPSLAQRNRGEGLPKLDQF